MQYSSFTKAVLLEMAINLNGMIAFGDKKQRAEAKKKFEEIKPMLLDLAQVAPKPSQEGHPFF